MAKTVLATFRVDEVKWKQFQAIAKEGGYSASALIVGFIDKNIASGIEVPPEPISVDIDANIDNRVAAYLDVNLDRYLDKYLDKFVERDGLQQIVNESYRQVGEAIEVAIEPIEMKVTKIEQTLIDLPHRVEIGNLDEVIPAAPTPVNLPSGRVDEVGEGLTIAELVAKIGKTRQEIEGYRSKERLGELGYRAEKVGKNWLYWEING